jgi:hypothetical protein
VLQVGEKQVLSGFNAERWEATLDEAGYPKTMPQQRRQPARTAAAPGPADMPAAPPADATPPQPPARGTDYPK